MQAYHFPFANLSIPPAAEKLRKPQFKDYTNEILICIMFFEWSDTTIGVASAPSTSSIIFKLISKPHKVCNGQLYLVLHSIQL